MARHSMNGVQEWSQKYLMICSPALHILYTDPFMFSNFINHQTEEFIMKVVQGWHGKARYQQKWCQVDILIFRRQRSQDFRGIYGAEGGPFTKHWIDSVFIEEKVKVVQLIALTEKWKWLTPFLTALKKIQHSMNTLWCISPIAGEENKTKMILSTSTV